MQPWLALAAFAGGRLHYVTNYWHAYSGHLGAAAFGAWPSGMHAPGAVVGIAIAVLISCWWFAVPVGRFADGMTPTIALGVAIARLGCFLQGCCFGTPCEGWWCVTFPTSHGAVHPLQLYFIANALAVLALVLWMIPRKGYDGQPALLGLLTFATGHAGLEFVRFDGPARVYWGPLPQLEWVLLAIALVALTALVVAHAARTQAAALTSDATSTVPRWRATTSS
jgi:phosphatidylglycerol:prolipoprotein diacylglycerol transferase